MSLKIWLKMHTEIMLVSGFIQQEQLKLHCYHECGFISNFCLPGGIRNRNILTGKTAEFRSTLALNNFETALGRNDFVAWNSKIICENCSLCCSGVSV